MHISLIIPMLNEEKCIEDNLKALQWVRDLGHEIIVVDGSSHDASPFLAEPWVDRIAVSPPGRAVQMNRGAKLASGDVFLFLHLDTMFPRNGIEAIISGLVAKPYGWGRFDVRLSGQRTLFRVIERMMNWRSRLTSITTGDQAIFITRHLFEKQGGFPDIPLMEDIEMSRQLKQTCKPVCLRQKVITSSRRWEVDGIYKTIWLMWRLRFAYWMGTAPSRLAQQYRQ